MECIEKLYEVNIKGWKDTQALFSTYCFFTDVNMVNSLGKFERLMIPPNYARKGMTSVLQMRNLFWGMTWEEIVALKSAKWPAAPS